MGLQYRSTQAVTPGLTAMEMPLVGRAPSDRRMVIATSPTFHIVCKW